MKLSPYCSSRTYDAAEDHPFDPLVHSTESWPDQSPPFRSSSSGRRCPAPTPKFWSTSRKLSTRKPRLSQAISLQTEPLWATTKTWPAESHSQSLRLTHEKGNSTGPCFQQGTGASRVALSFTGFHFFPVISDCIVPFLLEPYRFIRSLGWAHPAVENRSEQFLCDVAISSYKAGFTITWPSGSISVTLTYRGRNQTISRAFVADFESVANCRGRRSLWKRDLFSPDHLSLRQ